MTLEEAEKVLGVEIADAIREAIFRAYVAVRRSDETELRQAALMTVLAAHTAAVLCSPAMRSDADAVAAQFADKLRLIVEETLRLSSAHLEQRH